MMRRWLIVILAALGWVTANAQFYSDGAGATSEKWMQLKTPNYKLLYPVGYEIPASRFAYILDTIHPYLRYGINFNQRRIPIILRTNSVLSNGMVTWAPKREELIMTPDDNNYALSWSKGLAVHEGRHVAQISAMKRGLTKIATWVLGEAGVSLGLVVMSRWKLEGDATLAETQFAEYGRGLQPSFTVGYRAMFAQSMPSMRRLDPFVCGSYKNYYPDIYHYGYQVMSAANHYYSPDMWGEVLKFAGRWPILVVPDRIVLSSKKYKTSWRKIGRRAFIELDSIWRPYSKTAQNFEILTAENPKSYTTYAYPMSVDSTVIAIKTDFDNPARIVDIETGKSIARMGTMTSGPNMAFDKVYWTEYRPHPIFEQVSFSQIRELDLKTHKSRYFHANGRNFHVTPIEGGFASVAIDELSNSFIRFFDVDFNNVDTYRFGLGYEISLLELTWDAATASLYYIALDKNGMYIESLTKNGTQWKRSRLTAPSVVTISGLNASDGKLYFSSIESGKDEIHVIDIATTTQHRLTDSRFGSVDPAVNDSTLLFTTYTQNGTMVARRSVDTTSRPIVNWSRLPQNILNPVRKRWDVPIVDSIDGAVEGITGKSKKFNKAAHLFNLHSWAPIGVDVDAVLGARNLVPVFGATAFFQSTLGDLSGFATYGFLNNSNWVKGRFDYNGLPVTISLRAEYGGGKQLAYAKPVSVADVARELYFDAGIDLSLPLNYSGGGHLRLFRPTISVNYNNAIVWDGENRHTGNVEWSGSLWYSSVVHSAVRNLYPRLGYALQIGARGGFDDKFASQYYIYGRGYFPGVAKNHSLVVELGAQYQTHNRIMYGNKIIVPYGVSDPYATQMYGGVNAQYAAPIFYPDWGWDGVLYFKRLSVTAFGGYARGIYYAQGGGTTPIDRYSYGARLKLDFTLFQSFAQSLSFNFAFPSTSKGMFFGVSYDFGF